MSMHPGTDMERVRYVLARELETISEYEQLARESDDPLVRDFLAHLAAEEKEHVTEAVLLLRHLDPTQNAYFEKDIQIAHFSAHGSEKAEAPAKGSHAPAPPSAAGSTGKGLEDAASTFTVGGPNPELPTSPHDAGAALRSVPAAPSGHALPLTVGSLRHRR
ncbi:MAG TPA: ferritin [Myxococcaceae bacterium]|nr:ferritin [Myxococcaceae bacterium]